MVTFIPGAMFKIVHCREKSHANWVWFKISMHASKLFSALGEFYMHRVSQPIWPIYLNYTLSFTPGWHSSCKRSNIISRRFIQQAKLQSQPSWLKRHNVIWPLTLWVWVCPLKRNVLVSSQRYFEQFTLFNHLFFTSHMLSSQSWCWSSTSDVFNTNCRI